MENLMSIFAQSSDDLEAINESIAASGITWQDILLVVIIIGLSIPISSFVAKYVSKLFDKAAVKANVEPPKHLASFVSGFVKWGIRLAAVGWGASFLGADIGWITVFLALAAVIFVMMIKPLVETTAAGLVLQSRPSFSVGDEIVTKSHTGEVIEINARTTVLKTTDNRRIHIPNTEVLADPIVVYTAFSQRRSEMELLVDYDEDIDKITKILVEAMSKAEGVSKKPAPKVEIKGFDKQAYKLSLLWWHISSLSEDSKSTDNVARQVKKALDTANIGIYP